MHFPSDDELMAGPNAFESDEVFVDDSDIDAGELGALGDEVAHTTEFDDVDDADSQAFDDVDLDDASDIDPEDMFAVVEGMKALRDETNAGAGLMIPDFPQDFRA